MQYELKSVSLRRGPYTNKDGVYGVDIFIKTKIVDQTYRGFENLDSAFIPVSESFTTNQIENEMINFAVQFVKDKYPNT